MISHVSVQPFIEELAYKGSIINFESKSLLVALNIVNNLIEDCHVIGPNAALFYVSGGTLNAADNNFSMIGSLTNLTFT